MVTAKAATDTEAPQGDCVSASEFTFYQTKPLETSIVNDTPSLEEHNTIQSSYPIVPKNCQIDNDQ